ncbi:MAG: nucleoside-diphosphate kinase [Candidatus Peregrinibacteria bacterium]
MTAVQQEFSLVLFKPDIVKRGLVAPAMAQLEFSVLNQKQIEIRQRASLVFQFTQQQLERHYSHLVTRDFFSQIVADMTRTEVMAMIYGGKPGMIQAIRDVAGPTDPDKAPDYTIRGKYGFKQGTRIFNAIHSSEDQGFADAEIANIFPREQIARLIPELVDRVYPQG